MFFMLAGVIDKFHLLKYGLAIVLVFVGLKMVWLNPMYDGHFPIQYSLGFIIGTILISIVASLLFPAKDSHITAAANKEREDLTKTDDEL